MILRRHNTAITWFVICWSLVFCYETFRASYLSPLVGRPLPKLPLLFPPAGWIMFFNVDQTYGFAEVYGIRNGTPTRLDPHAILETRAVGYDNIHRNVLIGVLAPSAVATRQQCARAKEESPRNYWAAVLTGVCRDPADQPAGPLPFCAFLRRKFSDYDSFAVVYARYPDLIETPDRVLRGLAYRCE